MKQSAAYTALRLELSEAMVRFKPMTTPHEGWALIFEEVMELLEKIRKNQFDYVGMEDEAVQVAAMAMRFLIDLVPDEVI